MKCEIRSGTPNELSHFTLDTKPDVIANIPFHTKKEQVSIILPSLVVQCAGEIIQVSVPIFGKMNATEIQFQVNVYTFAHIY